MTDNQGEQVTLSDLGIWCGKTYPEPLAATKEKTSKQSSKKSQKSTNQFWGVPQRRKRIALVADFGGLSAPEILFERKGLSWNPAESGAEREGTSEGTGKGAESASGCMTGWDCQSKRIFDPESVCGTLNSGTTEGVNIVPSVFCLQGNGIDRADTAGCNGKGWTEDVSYTLNTIDRPAVMAIQQNASGEVRESDTVYAISTNSNPSGRNFIESCAHGVHALFFYLCLQL